VSKNEKKTKKAETPPDKRRYFVLLRGGSCRDWVLDPTVLTGLHQVEAERVMESWLAAEPEGAVLVIYGTVAKVEVERIKLHIKP